MASFVSRTVGDVVSEILMSRAGFSGALLVLEGDDDVKFWRARATARSECQMILAGGKATVVGAVTAAEKLIQSGVLGVIDDDCDSLLGQTVPSANLVRTEARDMETLMLSSQAFEAVLGELGDPAKIQALEQKEGQSIRDAFVLRALIFGQLRYLSAAQRWSVSFDRLSPWRFADVPSWTFDRSALLCEYAAQVPGLTVDAIEAHLSSIPVTSPWLILHGKDSLHVLAIGVRHCLGSQQHPIERILQMLRLAFSDLLFRATQLYKAVKNWEAANPVYRILAV
ncbi:MAG: DUF4435 domain-containing protein [Burkholderiaceae bacterium]|nr:DUF4435 domain-containing protein [Burkholderiaceae bacterium]